MPSGGKQKGAGRPRWFTDTDCLDIISDYQGLTDLRRLKGLPRPHRPIVVSVLAEYHETTPRMIERVLYGKLAKIKTAKQVRARKP